MDATLDAAPFVLRLRGSVPLEPKMSTKICTLATRRDVLARHIKMNLPTSKSFRIVLPSLACEDVKRLRRYCQDGFSASAIFTEPGDAQVIWLATRDRTRGAAAHRRSARALLAKLNIATCGLKGTWLVLATEEAVRAAVEQERGGPAQSCCAAPGNRDCQETRRASPSAANESSSSTPREGADEVKVIQLGRQDRVARMFSFEVVR